LPRPLVMIPGPTPVDPSVLAALGEPTYGHNQSAFVAVYRRVLDRLRRLLDADEVVAVGGAGTLAMEMALVNALAPGDALLVVSHGVFGDRFAEIARRYGWRVDVLSPDRPGAFVAPQVLASALAGGAGRGGGPYRAVTVTHVDTSTGVLAPVEAYLPAIRASGALFVLDGVCATGGIAEPMREWGVDYLVTTSQKALGVPPGFAILGLSARALARREALPTVPSYYADLANWLPIMRNPALYFATPPVNLIVALDRALELIEDETPQERFRRHERQARAVRAGLDALGLSLLTAAEAVAPTLSVVRYPDGVEDAAFRAGMEERGVVVAGGVGPLRGRVFRVGHMGQAGAPEILQTLAAVESTLASLGHRVELGAAVSAAQRILAG
jgi:alanine-glyoxylate transaminase/serine-glyoxylate transaminase/serine-pyruvate transaminase